MGGGVWVGGGSGIDTGGVAGSGSGPVNAESAVGANRHGGRPHRPRPIRRPAIQCASPFHLVDLHLPTSALHAHSSDPSFPFFALPYDPRNSFHHKNDNSKLYRFVSALLKAFLQRLWQDVVEPYRRNHRWELGLQRDVMTLTGAVVVLLPPPIRQYRRTRSHYIFFILSIWSTLYNHIDWPRPGENGRQRTSHNKDSRTFVYRTFVSGHLCPTISVQSFCVQYFCVPYICVRVSLCPGHLCPR